MFDYEGASLILSLHFYYRSLWDSIFHSFPAIILLKRYHNLLSLININALIKLSLINISMLIRYLNLPLNNINVLINIFSLINVLINLSQTYHPNLQSLIANLTSDNEKVEPTLTCDASLTQLSQ